jgi:hypothetical protein
MIRATVSFEDPDDFDRVYYRALDRDIALSHRHSRQSFAFRYPGKKIPSVLAPAMAMLRSLRELPETPPVKEAEGDDPWWTPRRKAVMFFPPGNPKGGLRRGL